MRLPNLRSRAGNASARPRRGHPEHQRVKPSPGNPGGHTTLHRRRKQPRLQKHRWTRAGLTGSCSFSHLQ